MPQKEAVSTDKAPPPLPFFSQAIKCQGMVYCSGSIGVDPKTSKLVEGNVADRTVLTPFLPTLPFPWIEGHEMAQDAENITKLIEYLNIGSSTQQPQCCLGSCWE